jgi:hypothetical protein
LAGSADGTKLFTAAQPSAEGPIDFILRSTNSGATWERTSAPAPWQSLACSADGTRLVALTFGPNVDSPIYTSEDSGLTWASIQFTGNVAVRFTGRRVLGRWMQYGSSIGRDWDLHSPIHPHPCSKCHQFRKRSATTLLDYSFDGLCSQQNSEVTGGGWTEVLTSPVLDYTHLRYEVRLPVQKQDIFYRLVRK